MRRLFLTLWLLLSLISILFAQSDGPETIFEEANRAYEEERYADALEKYRSVESTGVVSAPLYYNIGNTYFRLGRLGPAVLAYERARKLDPGNPQILHSARVARSRTQNDIQVLPEPGWRIAWRRVVVSLGASGLFWIAFILYLALIGLIAHWVWKRGDVSWRRRMVLVLAPLTFAILLAAYLASIETSAMDSAVVMVQETPLYERPELSSAFSDRIYEGLVVEMLGDAENGWIEVRLPDGSTGWVQQESLETI